MAEFKSWRDFQSFSAFVKCKARHFLDVKNEGFLEAVLETGTKRGGVVEKGAVLWRAQLGHDWRPEPITNEKGEEIDSVDVEDPFRPERMIPLRDRASEGRVNPKGIPCLYFSTDRETAMTEVRPWIGSYVSAAQFVMLRDLRIIDCSTDRSRPYFAGRGGDEPDPEYRERHVWWDMNRAFSEPATRGDDVAEYAPTQVLAEAFRSAGYDGIIYGSKLGSGRTVAVFDLTAADLVNCHLYRVEEVSLRFSMGANPYFMEKYCQQDNPSEITAAAEGTDDSAETGLKS